MSSALSIKLDSLYKIAKRADDPSLKRALMGIAKEPATVAIISQAINDNFQKSGPGWPPLKSREGKPLMKTGLLRASVTTPGAPGNIYRVDGSVVTWGTNLIYASIHNKGGEIRVKNAKFLWIPLTEKARKVGPLKDKRAQKSAGLVVGKDMVFKKSVRIPARPFLVIRDFWREQLSIYAVQRMSDIIKKWMGAA